MTINKRLQKRLAKQILGKVKSQLIHNPKDASTYQLSYGTYKISNYQGELLIEFDENVPVAGVYYGFQINNVCKIEESDIDNIDKLFAPIIQHLEFVLQKTIYLTDTVSGNKYWAFWLKCNDFDIESAKKHMEIIRDYFNQMIISKYSFENGTEF